MNLDDLPRLTDDECEALDDDYLIIPAALPDDAIDSRPTSKPTILAAALRILTSALAALASTFTLASESGMRPCDPPRGSTAAEVRALCKAPDEVFRTRSSLGWIHEEWRYGEVYVGLMDGRVVYVIN